jgi:hypothetical protein
LLISQKFYAVRVISYAKMAGTMAAAVASRRRDDVCTTNPPPPSSGASKTGDASSQVLNAARLLSDGNSRLKQELDHFVTTIRAG